MVQLYCDSVSHSEENLTDLNKCVVLDVVGSRSWCSLRTRLFTDLGARPWLVLYIVVDFALLEFGYFFVGFWTQEMSCVSVMVFGLADLRC